MKDFTIRINHIVKYDLLVAPKVVKDLSEIDTNEKEYYQIIFIKRNWCLIKIGKNENYVFYSDKTLNKFFDNFNKNLITDNENIFYIKITYILLKDINKYKDDFNYRDYISKLLYFMQTPINNFESEKLKDSLNIYPKQVDTLDDFFKKY